MSKRKLMSLALAACMAAILVVGGTLAYFTDTDSAVNTFTVGNVKIDLIEQERDGNGGLQNFTDNQVLMPIVGSAQGEKDKFGQPVAKNYIDKIVTVKNTGASDAYVRAYFAIPSALDDGYETFNAGANILHFNFGNKIVDGTVVSTEGVEWTWMHGNKWNYFETTIGGVAYNVYYADYYKKLPAGDTTEQFISGVYLDKNVDMDATGKYIDKRFPDADLSILNGTVSCPVMAVACQADGFDNADAAVTAAFGEKYNPFGGTATNWQ